MICFTMQIRGAINALVRLKEEKGDDFTVVTHSSGNHGQALALATKLMNVRGQVVMPDIAPDSKKAAVKGYGAELYECFPSEKVNE